jgi:type IV secretory pathway TrbD component
MISRSDAATGGLMRPEHVHRVYKSINKPLTIWGAERRLFFLAVAMGAGLFNFFGSLAGGVVMFAALFVFARWATATDPQILRILLNAKATSHYDPAKWAAPEGARR